MLTSFYFYGDTDIEQAYVDHYPDGRPDLFIDSGAFTAWSKEVPIDFERYYIWALRWAKLADAVATLDIIGDPKATRRNTLELRRRGLDVLDVFHVGERWAVLRRMCRERDYVALGGMVPYSSRARELKQWIAQAFKEGEKANPDVRFHGFGMTRFNLMRDFPWRSVDSSAWGSGFRYGSVPIFDPDSGRWFKVKKKDVKQAFDQMAVLRRCYWGVGAADLAIKSRWNRDLACAVAGMAYGYAEAWLNARISGEPIEKFLRAWPAGFGRPTTSNRTRWDLFNSMNAAGISSREGCRWLPENRRSPKPDLRRSLQRKAGRVLLDGR